MSRYKIQKSLAKPVWLPLDRKHYRSTPTTFRLKALYPRKWRWIQRRISDLRAAPFSFSVDTGRWFQRCPEQLVIGFKSFQNTFQLELAHTLRRPKYWKPIIRAESSEVDIDKEEWELEEPVRIGATKRAADFYYQHTPSYRYCLDNPYHIQAFLNLLNYSTSYVGGQHQGDAFRVLYRLDVFESLELARWPMPGLWGYDERLRTCVEATDGHEVLEVVCIPGERARRPKVLCRPLPSKIHDPEGYRRYKREEEHWQKQVSSCRSKQLMLRVRRVDAGRQDEPAFFLNDATELDLPLYAVERLASGFPAYWERLFNHYEKEGNRAWPRYGTIQNPLEEREYKKARLAGSYTVRNEIRKAEYDEYPHPDTGRLFKVKTYPAMLRGKKRDYRQMQWDPEVVREFMQPWMVKEMCRLESQPGLFLLGTAGQDKTEKELYQLRLALWDAGLVRWHPHCDSDAAEALEDYLGENLKQLQKLLCAFLVVWSTQRLRIGKAEHFFSSVLLPVSQLRRVTQLARGPPRS